MYNECRFLFLQFLTTVIMNVLYALVLFTYSVLLRSSDGRIPGLIINFVYGLIFCCNAQGRGSLYMSSLVGILLFLRRSGRWQMAGRIINAVFGLELVVSAQVWWWAVARADYKCRLWFGFLLYFASLAEAGCQG